jgi:hypothetical protein
MGAARLAFTVALSNDTPRRGSHDERSFSSWDAGESPRQTKNEDAGLKDPALHSNLGRQLVFSSSLKSQISDLQFAFGDFTGYSALVHSPFLTIRFFPVLASSCGSDRRLMPGGGLCS